jgi:hypothetical protein
MAKARRSEMSSGKQYSKKDPGFFESVEDRKYGPDASASADEKFCAAMRSAHPAIPVGVKVTDPSETVSHVRFRPSAAISLEGSSAAMCADLGNDGGGW